MTLRGFLDAAFAFVVDELRRQGASLYDALTAAKDAFQDPSPEELAARARQEEIEKARATQETLKSLGRYGALPPRRKTTPPPDLPEGAPA